MLATFSVGPKRPASLHLAVLFSTIALLPGFAISAPSISITTAPSSVPKFEKLEVDFTINNVGAPITDYNPFNPNITDGAGYWNKKGIYVDAVFTKPSGGVIHWPAFYEGSGWKFRFSPTEEGIWKYYIYVRHESGTGVSGERSVQVTPAVDPRGFVEVNPENRHTFRFSGNKEPFFPLGQDASCDGCSTSTETRFTKMQANNGNYARAFFENSQNIEPYDTSGALNHYEVHYKNNSSDSTGIDNARKTDNLFDAAHRHGIYMDNVVDSWTYVKDASFAYIQSGLVATPDEFFTSTAAKEVYKRKLRYRLARFGYSVNLMTVELINEAYSSTAAYGWHVEMGNFIQGDKSVIPSSWGGGGQTMDLAAQPHLASSSNGTDILRASNIPWDSASMSYPNMHFYMRDYVTWGMIQGSYEMETLGSALAEPWLDTAVVANRVARIAHKRYRWNKPISVTEFGLAVTGIVDWDAAYIADPEGRHFKDAIWAGIFSFLSLTHWKGEYIDGSDPTGSGPEKYSIYKPAGNFLKGADFSGMASETAYPVADPLNSNPSVTSSNSNIMAIAIRDDIKGYVYVKNLTDTWARAISGSGAPSAASQSGVVMLKGLMASKGYIIERWSTLETDPARQKLSQTSLSTDSSGNLAFSVSVGTSAGTYDYAYKVYPASAPTATPTAPHTPVSTVTPLPTRTATHTGTSTYTRTAAPSMTRTATNTAAATATSQATATPRPTVTQTSTKTPLPTRTATSTRTSTATATPTAQSTATATPRPTMTQTSTKTALPTRTATSTPTSSATSQATATATPRPTTTTSPRMKRHRKPRADFNGDGLVDIVSYGRKSKVLRATLSNASESLEQQVSLPTAGRQANGDYNGDGSWDIGSVYTLPHHSLQWGAYDVQSGRALWTEQFGGRRALPLGGCDLDGDKTTDLVVIERRTMGVKMSSTGGEYEARIPQLGKDAFCADVNGDGVDELVAFARKVGGMNLALIALDGKGTRLLTIDASRSIRALAADLNDDGFEELALVRHKGKSNVIEFVTGEEKPSFVVPQFSDSLTGIFGGPGDGSGAEFAGILLKMRNGTFLRLNLETGAVEMLDRAMSVRDETLLK